MLSVKLNILKYLLKDMCFEFNFSVFDYEQFFALLITMMLWNCKLSGLSIRSECTRIIHLESRTAQVTWIMRNQYGWRSWRLGWTPVGSNLGCLVLLSLSYLNHKHHICVNILPLLPRRVCNKVMAKYPSHSISFVANVVRMTNYAIGLSILISKKDLHGKTSF